MFEHRSEPLISRANFIGRLGRVFLIMLAIIAFSLLLGTLGYRLIAGLQWSDAFFQACLVLGEHAVERHPDTTVGKVFAGLYVMYARLVFFTVVALLFVPVLHRVLHKLHLESSESE
jgi:hypothetical protein